MVAGRLILEQAGVLQLHYTAGGLSIPKNKEEDSVALSLLSGEFVCYAAREFAEKLLLLFLRHLATGDESVGGVSQLLDTVSPHPSVSNPVI